jgi:hypothetical protein
MEMENCFACMGAVPGAASKYKVLPNFDCHALNALMRCE